MTIIKNRTFTSYKKFAGYMKSVFDQPAFYDVTVCTIKVFYKLGSCVVFYVHAEYKDKRKGGSSEKEI